MEDVQNLAFYTGLLFGSLAIIAVTYVWMRHQTFGLGGGMLSVVGIVLIGLSVWREVHVVVSATGVEASLKQLEKKVAEVARDTQQLDKRVTQVATVTSVAAKELVGLAQTVETDRKQFIELTRVLEARKVVDSPSLGRIREPLQKTPSIEPGRVKELIRPFDRPR